MHKLSDDTSKYLFLTFNILIYEIQIESEKLKTHFDVIDMHTISVVKI